MRPSGIPWPLKRTSLTLGAHTLLLDRVADQDALLEALLAKGSDHPDVRDERVPYWGDLWPSAMGLSEYLVQTDWLKDVGTVHEIGCGLALPGIVSGFYGCEVILSDYLDDALQLAQHNWQLNHQRPMRTTLVDWRAPDISLAADLILASDVAYEARAFEPLVNAFHVLCKQGGRILLAEPGRERAKPFLEQLPGKGFSVENTLVNVSLNGRRYSIHILELRPL